ncbi:hypothetical protein Tco_0187185 [Tanacetum coccineum]
MHLSNVTTNDMFQPWRALATIINLCLTGKTSGFERPRAPALQILWGIVNRAHIDYAERINLVIRHRVEDFQLGIESYQTQLNLTKPRWEATGFEFKHDYTVIDSPRAVTFRDRYGV